MPSPDAGPIAALLALMQRLRDPERGCPWDLEQSFSTIAPYTIEEAYEVADAIARGDTNALKDELGDLLFQVVFHAQMADEAGDFSFGDVTQAIVDKMERRHPHIFGAGPSPDSAADQSARWEAMKAAERQAKAATSALDDVPLALPALTRALKLQKRLSRVGFDWNGGPEVLEKLEEELRELTTEIAAHASPERLEDEFGDILFVAVNIARHLGIDPEAALRSTNAKVTRRFGEIEQRLKAAGSSPEEASLEEMDALWSAIKAEEKKPR
ncbi:MAG: nucleoside triphosphate pyrophosphohydrolase [Alphaproteobacteria bacterium]|nr:nucleoside triphosphate pyrophosphohydrolase [Alphaproteobacteria bacterium]